MSLSPRKVLSDWKILAVIALSLIAFGATGWAFRAIRPRTKQRSSGYTHLHCPACKRELLYRAALVGKRCNACGARAVYVPTVGSFKGETSAGAKWSRVLALLILDAVLVQSLAYLVVVRLRKLREQELNERNRMIVSRCPFCQRKIRYKITRAGSGTICIRCKTAFLLPSLD